MTMAIFDVLYMLCNSIEIFESPYSRKRSIHLLMEQTCQTQERHSIEEQDVIFNPFAPINANRLSLLTILLNSSNSEFIYLTNLIFLFFREKYFDNNEYRNNLIQTKKIFESLTIERYFLKFGS